MTRDNHYESEFTAGREDVAAVLSGVADGVLAGSIRLGDGPDAVAVEMPEQISVEMELETDDDESELEVELEWPSPEGEGSPVSSVEQSGEAIGEPPDREEQSPEVKDESLAATDELSVPVGAANTTQSLARFEVFRDRGEKWRWRLRHRNGNIIATSGQGYTRKHNALKGLRSVVENTPGAEVTEDSTE